MWGSGKKEFIALLVGALPPRPTCDSRLHHPQSFLITIWCLTNQNITNLGRVVSGEFVVHAESWEISKAPFSYEICGWMQHNHKGKRV